jgi:hypothetical protein
MPDARNSRKPELTVVQGGKIAAKDFIRLPLAEKLSLVRNMPAKNRITMIEADPEAKHLVRTFPPQELYWMIKETGETDANALVELSSPEQCEFILDMELWEKSSLSQAKALEWLGHLLEAGEARIAEQLPHLDLETLIIIFLREITVGGGAGELLADEERTADWDHSFDNLYFISFRNPKHARLIGSFLEVIYRHDTSLYTQLMEEAKYELESEMEELAYSFRTGRLADLGFPEREEALSIYARLDPAAFVPAGDKRLLPVAESVNLPVPVSGDSLLQRSLAQHSSAELLMELNYLLNNALVAEETAITDRKGLEALFQRVYGYLNIALEFLCGNDAGRAADILEGEYLKRLFQLGHGIVQGLKKKVEYRAGGDYATGKALQGLKARPPRFYRGLDADGVDGYREFGGMDDVKRVEEFLKKLGD